MSDPAPRLDLPTLAEIPEDAPCEERVLAYADMAAAYHQICRRLEWELERSNAERSMLRHEVESLRHAIDDLRRLMIGAKQ